MNPIAKTPESLPFDSAGACDPEGELFRALEDVFDRIYPAVLILGGVAIAASLVQTLAGTGSCGFFVSQLLLYLMVVAVTLIRHRLDPRVVFSLFLSFVYVIAVASLFNRGLAGSGNIHMIFFCVLAGVYFSLRKAMTILAAGVATVLLIGVGLCSGLFATQPDAEAYLIHPVNWLLQVSCIVLYSVPLVLSMKGLLRKLLDSRAELQRTNLKLLAEMAVRQEAEQALVESEANYRSIVESSVAGFFTIQDHLYRFVNQRACEITGYDSSRIVNGMRFTDPIHPDDRETVTAHVEKCLTQQEEIVPFDARLVCKNGRIIMARFMIGRTLLNNAPAFSGTFVDITRERSLETQLRQAQKMQTVGQLAGGIAHDFNNILTAFNGYGRLLQMKTPPEDPRRSYVDQMLSASRKAGNLTQNLLTFSRRQPPVVAPVEINQQIRDTEKLLQRLLTEDIAFTVRLSDERLTTLADATQVDRVLFNLVTNARDAMPQGGQLMLETGLAVLDGGFRERHGFGKPGNYARISLTDRGVGMDRETLEQIFDPFFTTKEPGQGTGLGLATVYAIVKQHDGYIVAESRPGQGATFHVYFPAIRAAVTDSVADPEESLPGGRETILIADDHEEVRAFMRDVLTLVGYRIVEAADGEEALRRFRKTPAVDLAILDMVMPQMNGKDACEAMRQENPLLKALFISGHARKVILLKGLPEKESHFLAKPLSPVTLLEKVREVLDR